MRPLDEQQREEGRCLRDWMLRALNAAFKVSGPVHRRWSSETGINHYAETLISIIHAHEPEGIQPQELFRVSPYTDPSVPTRFLEETKAAGYVEQPGGLYRLTERGRSALAKGVDAIWSSLKELDWLPAGDAVRLGGMLARIVEAALAFPEPEPWYLRQMTKLTSPDDSPVPYVVSSIFSLEIYRYDCHWAAWQFCGLSPLAVDVLSVLWTGEADSLDSIDKLRGQWRGHSRETLKMAVEELLAAGYVQGTDEALSLTPAGRRQRDDIEQRTDDLHWAPYFVLSGSQRADMQKLLERFAAGGRVFADTRISKPG